MKVKYLVSMAGDRFVRNVGDVGEVEDAEAKRFIDAGFAEAVDEGSSEEKEPQPKKKK